MPDELRDIKGVLYIFDWGTMLFFLALALLSAVLGYLLFKYIRQWRRNRNPVSKKTAAPDRPFNEVALEALMQIDPVAYYEKGRIKEFYIEITDIVRRFLTGNYRIDTLDKTSLEIVEEVERVERDYARVRNLDRYLSECDLVKFAKFRPGLAEMKQKRAESEQIVREYFRGV